jgi:hypothetical protein
MMGRLLSKHDDDDNDTEMHDSDEEQEPDKLHLPLHIDTLKRRLRSQLPMLRLLKRPITVTLEKQATLQALEKGKPARETTVRCT